MKKNEHKYYSVEFLLEAEDFQKAILDKRFKIAGRIYNQSLKKTLTKYGEMAKTKKYRGIKEELQVIKESKKNREEVTNREKELYEELNEIYKENGFTQFDISEICVKQAKQFETYIDSNTAQSMGNDLWKIWNEFLVGDGEMPYLEDNYIVGTLRSRNSKTGMEVRTTTSKHWDGERLSLVWNGLTIPVIVNPKSEYEAMVLKGEIVCSTIRKKKIRTKTRYLIQILFKGTPPVKLNKKRIEANKTIESDIASLESGIPAITVV